MQIAALYGRLVQLDPSPVAQLNLAAAIGMARGPLAGLAALEEFQLDDQLRDYHWYHSARADLFRRAGYLPRLRRRTPAPSRCATTEPNAPISAAVWQR